MLFKSFTITFVLMTQLAIGGLVDGIFLGRIGEPDKRPIVIKFTIKTRTGEAHKQDIYDGLKLIFSCDQGLQQQRVIKEFTLRDWGFELDDLHFEENICSIFFRVNQLRQTIVATKAWAKHLNASVKLEFTGDDDVVVESENLGFHNRQEEVQVAQKRSCRE